MKSDEEVYEELSKLSWSELHSSELLESLPFRKRLYFSWNYKRGQLIAFCAALIIIIPTVQMVIIPAVQAVFEPSSANDTDSKQNVIRINADQLGAAIYYGKDDSGKTKAQYFLELAEGATVIATNAFVYARDTSNSDAWSIAIGDNTPRIVCRQITPEAKRVAATFEKKLEGATVAGELYYISNDIVYFKNCIIVGGKEL